MSETNKGNIKDRKRKGDKGGQEIEKGDQDEAMYGTPIEKERIMRIVNEEAKKRSRKEQEKKKRSGIRLNVTAPDQILAGRTEGEGIGSKDKDEEEGEIDVGEDGIEGSKEERGRKRKAEEGMQNEMAVKMRRMEEIIEKLTQDKERLGEQLRRKQEKEGKEEVEKRRKEL